MVLYQETWLFRYTVYTIESTAILLLCLEIQGMFMCRFTIMRKDIFKKELSWQFLGTTNMNPGAVFRMILLSTWLDRANVCVVRYEDFLVDAEKELGKVFTYLGEPVRNNRIKEVVSYHSFKNETKRRYGEERQSGEEDKYKFQRKGIAGDWKNHFNKESCELIQKYEWDSLKRLGYEEDPSWPNKYLQQSNKI